MSQPEARITLPVPACRRSIGVALLIASLVMPAAVAQDRGLFQPEGSPIAVPLPPPLPAARLAAAPPAESGSGDAATATSDIPETVAPEDITVTPPVGGPEPPPSPLTTDGLPPPTGTQLATAVPPSTRVTTVPGETVLALADEGGVRLLYALDGDTIDEAGRGVLGGIAEQAQADAARRIEIRAYAAGTPDLAAHARRLSLDRALGVRAFLIDRGIASARIDVRALGNTAPDGPADRVDVFLR